MRYRVGLFVLCTFLCLCLGFPQESFGDTNDSTFTFPVKNHTIIRAFEKPATQYSAGHRGVDFAAPRGTSVYAAADGQAIFAGRVAGSLHVTISHGNNIKSTYTFLATTIVKAGDAVSKGQLLGTTAGGAPASPNTFLFTMRIKNQYVDPMPYLLETVPVREIRLGEIKKEGASTLKKLVTIERKNIQKFFDVTESLVRYEDKAAQEITRFIEDFVTKGGTALDKTIKNLERAHKDATQTLQEMKTIAQQIIRDSSRGLTQAVKAGMKKLEVLQKEAIKKIKKTITLAQRLGQDYLRAYRKALALGVDVAKWFVKRTVMVPVLMAQLQRDLLQGVYDASIVGVHTTMKILDQYFDVDWAMMIRELALPVSCFAYACTAPIKLACDPSARFTVRTRSDGYTGSGNGVMFVSGINSGGSTSVAKDDKGTGEKVGQPVNFPYKTLGYSRDDVSYYSYEGVGESFESNAPFQDLHVSAARMDDQIRQWKKDHPKEKLDLIAHSLGGSVTALWLAEFYDADNTAYPRLGKVIMYAPPLTGTASATAGSIVDSDDDSLALHDDLNEIVGSGYIPPSDSQSMQQITEGGELAKILSKTSTLKKVKVHIIRSASDIVVTAGSPHIAGTEEVILDTDTANPLSPITAHSDIITDKSSTAAAQHILESRKVPCVSPTNAASSIIKATTVHAAEVTISRVARDTLNAADYGTTSRYLNAFVG